jgi:hypothetical protein
MSDATNNDDRSAAKKGRGIGFAWIFEECLLPVLLTAGVAFAVVDGVLSINGGAGIV